MDSGERHQSNGIGDEAALAEDTSVPGLLKLIAAGATGPILMALGPRPLRTRKLTERVPTYAPRTLYRHTRKLAEMELIDRREIAGVPSTVIHRLSNPRGRELFRLLDAYATAVDPQRDADHVDDGLWTSLGLLGEMWTFGWVEHLSRGGQSATELAEATQGMTFHQVSRRTHQLMAWDLLHETVSRGHRKRYHLTHQARQGMALIAGLGRWRQRHVLDGDESGLTAPEMATLLRTCLPLIELSENENMDVKLGIVGAADEQDEPHSETLTASVGAEGRVRCVKDRAKADAWALGAVATWFAAILDGNRGRLRVGGDLELVDSCLKRLYEVLWPARVEVGAG